MDNATRIKCGQVYVSSVDGAEYVLDGYDGGTCYLVGRKGREITVSEARLRSNYTRKGA